MWIEDTCILGHKYKITVAFYDVYGREVMKYNEARRVSRL